MIVIYFIQIRSQYEQEQKVLKTSTSRVNFMFSKQKSKSIYLKSHKTFKIKIVLSIKAIKGKVKLA